MPDYYTLLGVDKTASQEEIRASYRKLALELHPDRNPGDPEAEKKFKEISEAYSILSDVYKRKGYDWGGTHTTVATNDAMMGELARVVESLFNFKVDMSPVRMKRKAREGRNGTCEPCPHCKGSGKMIVTVFFLKVSGDCIHCFGEGTVRERKKRE